MLNALEEGIITLSEYLTMIAYKREIKELS
jgi:hypothetical protein